MGDNTIKINEPSVKGGHDLAGDIRFEGKECPPHDVAEEFCYQLDKLMKDHGVFKVDAALDPSYKTEN